MPTWKSGDIEIKDGSLVVGQFRVEISPDDWRRLPLVRYIAPFTTGSEPKFSIRVKRLNPNDGTDVFTLTLTGNRPPLSNNPGVWERSWRITGNVCGIPWKDEMIVQGGRHVYIVSIETIKGLVRQSFRGELVVLSIEAKDIDDFRAWTIGILASFLGGGLVCSLLTWWLLR